MITVYDPDKHFAMLCKWMTDRDAAPPPEWAVPPSGFVVEDVAAGFLILTNNNIGILDFYISNPYASGREKDQAIDLITKELIEFAKTMGLKIIQCSSRISSIQSRALKHGFKKDGDFAFYTRGV